MTKTAKKTAKKTAPRYVLVTTTSRPWTIVAGTLASEDGDRVTLKDARMIVYFSEDVHALLGCAVRGPGCAARVSPRVDEITIRNVEAVIAVSDVARTAIEDEPWR